jgi:hypothetical protein
MNAPRELALVLMDPDNQLVHEFKPYPTIPPIDHLFTFMQGKRKLRYRVNETQSIIDLNEENVPRSERTKDEDYEVIRVEVELVH